MPPSVLTEFLNACRDHDGNEPSKDLRRVTGEFLARAREDAALVTTATGSLTSLPPAGAAWLAVVIGAAVENGTSAELTTSAVVDLLVSWLAKLPVVEPDDEESMDDWEPTPEQAELLEAFPELGQSVVAHLARMPERRAELARDEALLDRLESLEGLSNGIGWVREALIRSSGTLIILYPPSGKGFRLRYQNVGLCFHLFSLLQAAIGKRIPGGRAPDPAVAAAARGQASDDVTDEAWWHYGDPGWQTAELNGSIWGEALVSTIPLINGVPVVLLWPAILESRSWSTNFGPHLAALPADLVVEEELSPEASRAWLQAVGL